VTQDTLPDLLRPGLRLLSIGLNPSLPSVAAGFYFANPRNRFWKALNASRLVGRQLEPGVGAQDWLFEHAAMGFTDVVKRPTAGAAELRAADYRAGAPRLLEKLRDCQPAMAWFHGRLAWQQFLRHALPGSEGGDWGLQPLSLGATRFFVTPNPSPANAAFSLADLAGWYDRLALAVDGAACDNN